MIDFSWLELTSVEWLLIVTVILLAGLNIMSLRRLSALESKLLKVQVSAHREIKMVNQGAIGIGRRFAVIEKNLKKSKNVARFEAPLVKEKKDKAFKEVVQSIKPSRPEPTVSAAKPRSGHSTRAEQALSSWINDHQTA